MRRVLIALFFIAVLAALAAFGVFTVHRAQPQTAAAAGTPTAMTTDIGGLPPFANPDFDVQVSPPIVTVPQNGGSVSVLVTLQATRLNTSKSLVLETHSRIPGYVADFRPTSIVLQPGDSTSVELTILIPRGIQNGTYPMSVVARGETTQGGGWLIIVVGPAQTIPPP